MPTNEGKMNGLRRRRRTNGRTAVSRATPPSERWDDVPRLTLPPADDLLLQILQKASLALLHHPVAAQAVFSAFVAEGRRFAETPEGRQWKAALADSELVRRGTAVWEGSVLNTLEDNSAALLPSTILDAIVQAAGRRDVVAFLDNLQKRLIGALDDS